MLGQTQPLLSVKKSNGRVEEVIVGACAGRALVYIIVILAMAALLFFGVIDPHDAARLIRPVLRL